MEFLGKKPPALCSQRCRNVGYRNIERAHAKGEKHPIYDSRNQLHFQRAMLEAAAFLEAAGGGRALCKACPLAPGDAKTCEGCELECAKALKISAGF
jgi:hypothetical protein